MSSPSGLHRADANLELDLDPDPDLDPGSTRHSASSRSGLQHADLDPDPDVDVHPDLDLDLDLDLELDSDPDLTMTVTPGRGSDPTQRVQSLGFTARYLLLRLVNLLICTQSQHVVTDQSNCHRCVGTSGEPCETGCTDRGNVSSGGADSCWSKNLYYYYL